MPASLRLLFLAACQPVSCPHPAPLCPALTGTSTLTSACASEWPACAQLFCRAARQDRSAFVRRQLAFSHLDVGPPASSARMPCPVTGTFLSPPARALPAARHGRPARLVYLLHACTACDFFVAPPAACLPPVTSCTFLEQAIPQLWAASSKLACVAFRISA